MLRPDAAWESNNVGAGLTIAAPASRWKLSWRCPGSQNAAGRRCPKIIAVLEQIERIVRSCGNFDEIAEAAGKLGHWIHEVVAKHVP
jgi:hypothetical protein